MVSWPIREDSLQSGGCLDSYLVRLVYGALAIQYGRTDGRGRDNQLGVLAQGALLLHRGGAAVVELPEMDTKSN